MQTGGSTQGLTMQSGGSTQGLTMQSGGSTQGLTMQSGGSTQWIYKTFREIYTRGRYIRQSGGSAPGIY
jgi:hypothetical protein